MSGAANVDQELMLAGGNELATREGTSLVSSAEGYERWAATYDLVPNPLLAREERYLFPLLADLQGRSILDLACGTGRWLERLVAQNGISGVGIDCSAAMLGIAAKKKAINKQLARAESESLPFCSAAFDLAVCSFALGHIRDLVSVARELASVMKAGADLFVSDLHPEAYAHGWHVGFRDEGVALQIETVQRTTEEIIYEFCNNGFECQTVDSLQLGEPERAVFEIAGKANFFTEACQIPAVFVAHFKRQALSINDRSCKKQAREVRP